MTSLEVIAIQVHLNVGDREHRLETCSIFKKFSK